MNKLAALLIALSFLSSSLPPDIFSFQTITIHNDNFAFRQLQKNKATVFIFLLADCPATQSYTTKLNKLSAEVSKKNIQFVGIFPGKFSTDAELSEFQWQYKIRFALLKDPEMKLAAQLHADIAPSCCIINQSGQLVYQGRIDDYYSSLGKSRQVITEDNLKEAMDSVIAGKTIRVKKTKAVGCILEYDYR